MGCSLLESLPESVGNLTSLTTLYLSGCSKHIVARPPFMCASLSFLTTHATRNGKPATCPIVWLLGFYCHARRWILFSCPSCHCGWATVILLFRNCCCSRLSKSTLARCLVSDRAPLFPATTARTCESDAVYGPRPARRPIRGVRFQW